MIRMRLLAEPAFAAHVPDTRLFNAGSIQSAPDLSSGKFGLLRFDSTLPGVGPVNRAQFFLYVYDRMGSYSGIRAALEVAKERLRVTDPIDHGDGYINQILWQGISGELVDDVWRASLQFATFEVVFSGT